MGIDWKRFGAGLKRRREKAGMTQDTLAAKVGVRLATIGRLEIGNRRPSLDLLEQLAAALRCRVRDLLPEEDLMTSVVEREPSLRGVPTFFRARVMEAANRRETGTDPETGKRFYADYAGAGRTLGGSLGSLLSEEAYADLGVICDETNEDAFRRKLLRLLERDLPGCMALVPSRRKDALLLGVSLAIAEGRLDFGSAAAERIAEDWKERKGGRR